MKCFIFSRNSLPASAVIPLESNPPDNIQTRGTSAINCLFTVSCKIDKICEDVSSIESVWNLLSKFQYLVTTFYDV